MSFLMLMLMLLKLYDQVLKWLLNLPLLLLLPMLVAVGMIVYCSFLCVFFVFVFTSISIGVGFGCDVDRFCSFL